VSKRKGNSRMVRALARMARQIVGLPPGVNVRLPCARRPLQTRKCMAVQINGSRIRDARQQRGGSSCARRDPTTRARF
jgi:hypothetical protein